jgi:hypothetical protein
MRLILIVTIHWYWWFFNNWQLISSFYPASIDLNFINASMFYYDDHLHSFNNNKKLINTQIFHHHTFPRLRYQKMMAPIYWKNFYQLTPIILLRLNLKQVFVLLYQSYALNYACKYFENWKDPIFMLNSVHWKILVHIARNPLFNRSSMSNLLPSCTKLFILYSSYFIWMRHADF